MFGHHLDTRVAANRPALNTRGHRFGPRAAFALVLGLSIAASAQAQVPRWPASESPPAVKDGIESIAEPRDASAALEQEIQALQARPGGLTAAQAARRAVASSYDIAEFQQKGVGREHRD